MEKTILNKSNSLLKNIGNMFESIFGERKYEDAEINQINSEEDIIKLMNDGNDSNNANNDGTKDKEISKILLSGLKEETFNINMSDKAGKETRKPQTQEPGKEKDKGSQQKADKEIGEN